MLMTAFSVISSDSHVIEPHDLWQKRVAAQFRDRAPQLVRDETTDRLVCDDAELPPVGLLAGCARSDDQVRRDGRWEEDVFVGGYDPVARLADLERDGVDAEVLYPTIAMQLYPIRDAEFQWALFRAYNDWLAEEFCASSPARFKGIAMLNHEQPQEAVAELHRAKDKGLAGVMVPLFAGEANPYHDTRNDLLWAAAQEAGMAVSLHAATTRDRSRAWDKGTPTDAILNSVPIQRVLIDCILSGVFDRFPNLKLVSAENDAGWAGALLERADFWWRRSRRIARDAVTCANPPSTYFHNNVRVTFMRDRTAVLASEIIGPEVLMWGNDFPHHVSTWPNSKKVLDEHFFDQPTELRNRIVRDNGAALYGF
jgi:predicted TIM-barrel fold metal-dependent hydrolase